MKKLEPVVPVGDPCRTCNATGLIDGGFKYRKTCPDCRGTRYQPADLTTQS